MYLHTHTHTHRDVYSVHTGIVCLCVCVTLSMLTSVHNVLNEVFNLVQVQYVTAKYDRNVFDIVLFTPNNRSMTI